MVTISFKDGTLLLDEPRDTKLPITEFCVYDVRVNAWRAEAFRYADIVMALYRNGIKYDDRARNYATLNLRHRTLHKPRDYQMQAVEAWKAASRRGVIVLPTGTGKSFVAQMAIACCNRSTLVVVPTLDLMEQWARQLSSAFGLEIGLLGGGSKDLRDLTVSTYDSAVLMMESIGNRIGLLVIDECHHLPGPTYQLLAKFCLAPFRLGLTATPERDDGMDAELVRLLGPTCFRKDIDEMEGDALAEYRTETIPVELSEEELVEYQTNRQVYVDFLRAHRINLSSSRGWQQFLLETSRRRGGREALNAYLRQREISRASKGKLDLLWMLFAEHSGERILVFTADNQTAYEIGERFCLPVLTHHTKISERRNLLGCFRNGELPILVTSKILNEGVDVPEASVGVVVSGSGSIREHVQRLGRILRPSKGKQAVLYELISAGTAEAYVSERRRQHRAYERPDSM
ncbi:MAG: DEAD/DEAH box helicase [Lentisphaerae bacterium]|jgi:superfamily II DNA or RNA helicase|nr:DEAD/DEAH box helicase [Lentisphaerota bacterium]